MFFLTLSTALAFETGANDHLELKWVRDSEEYAALTTQVFRTAEAAVLSDALRRARRGDWAVVLDIDETVLDNSPYFLELAAYDRPFDWPSWDAWCERRVAQAIPGAASFIRAIRAAGGRVAFVSNRHERTRRSTVDNLVARGLMEEGDRLCLLTDDEAYTKRVRRTQIREGTGPCGWAGEPVTVLAYLGDTMADLPEADEDVGRWDALGSRVFVLPNPMYGSWEHAVTRPELVVPR